MQNNPQFLIYTGPMFSSKTSRLLASLERYRYQHKKIAVFKPSMDDRYSLGEVVTHGGWKTPAMCIKTGVDILEHLANIDDSPNVIAVDEAFMIPGISETLIWLYRSGFTVLVSSLEMSATGKPFHEIEKMMVWATHIEKCTAVCTVCGRDAHYTHKKQTGGDEIEVGGSELYEPRCFSHHVIVDNRPQLHEVNN
jgi:thymidine kinase